MALPLINAASPAYAAAVACGTNGTPAVTFLSDPVFTMSLSDSYDANYIGYKVTPTAAVKDLWVGLGNFTGGVITLAPNQSAYQASGPVAANTSAVSYFLAKGATVTTSAQSHTVTIYEGNPNAGTATVLCTATNTFTRVEDTITANSNKVNTINVSSATGTLGATIDVTVQGETGTVGSGPSYDLGVINLAPAVQSSFPANAWRLTKVVYNDTTNSRTFNDILHFNGEAGPSYLYTAKYSFVAVGTTSTAATVLPIQYIASGTQIKHTGAVPATLPTIPAVTNSLTMTKTANTAQLGYTGGDVEYTVKVNNTGAATSVDQIVDVFPTDATFKTGSATKNGVAVADPVMSGRIATFVGPYSVPASSSLVFKYVLTYGAVTGLYTNSASGYVSSTKIDSTLTTGDNAPASATIFVLPFPPNVSPAQSTATGPNTYTFTPVTTDPGSSIDPNATCVIDPNTLECVKTFTDGGETWTVEPDGDITFTPSPTFTGESTVTYIVSDEYDQTDSSTLTVNIVLPPAPTVDAASKSMYGWSPSNVTVNYDGVGVTAETACLIVDADCVKTYYVEGEGTWTVETDGTVTFDPDFGYRGTTSPVQFRVADQYGQTAYNNVVFTVTAPDAPISGAIAGTTNFDSNITYIPSFTNNVEIVLTSVCIVDPADGWCKKTVTIAGEGTYTVDETTGEISFNPERGFTGETTPLTYKAEDIYGQTSSNTVTTNVLLPSGPTLPDEFLETSYNTPVSGIMDVALGDGQVSKYCFYNLVFCVTDLTVEGEGTWTVSNDGTVTFTPERYFTGEATPVNVTVEDEWGNTDEGTVYATVGVPSAPLGDHAAGVALWNMSSTIKPTVEGELIDWTTFCIVDPADGVCKKSFTIEGVGSFSVDIVTGETTYTPSPLFQGVAPHIHYQVEDGWGQIATNVLEFSSGLPDAPTVDAVNVSTSHDTPVSFIPTFHSEADVDTSEFCIVDGDSCVTTLVTSEGTFTVDLPSGEVVFTPADKFYGNVSTQIYRGEDIFHQQATNTINITVAKPAAPAAYPVSDSVTYGAVSTQSINAEGTDLVLSTLCIVSGSECVKTLTVSGEGTWTANDDGTITFAPEKGFHGDASQISYMITDYYGQSSSSSADVNVAAPPAGPTVSPIVKETLFDTDINITVVSDNNVGIDPLMTCLFDGLNCVRDLTIDGVGVFTVNNDGSITFNPERGFTGDIPTVTFQVTDEYGQTATKTLDVNVGSPEGPTIYDASGETPYNTEITMPIIFTEGTGTAATFCIVNNSECVKTLTVDGEGTWTVSNDGTAVFAPQDGFVGTTSNVTLKIVDEFGLTDISEAHVTVDMPAPPTADHASNITLWRTPVSVSPNVNGANINWDTFCIVDPADNVCKLNFETLNGSYQVDTVTHQVWFTPALHFAGLTEHVTYEITDGFGQKATNSIQYSVGMPPHPSIADVNRTIDFNSSVTFTPEVTSETWMDESFCIIDGDSCVTTLTITEGTFAVNASTGEVVFTPANKFYGTVPPQTYRGTNIFTDSATGTINIVVSEPSGPILTDENPVTAPYDTNVIIDLTASSTDGEIVDFCIQTGDACVKELTVEGEGTWTVNESGVLTFNPEDAFVGTASPVTVKVVDEFGLTDVTEININVELPQLPSVNPISGNAAFGELAYAAPNSDSVKILTISTCIIDPADSVCKNSVTVSGEGTWEFNASLGLIIFTPEHGFTGTATQLTYQMSDIWGRTATNTIDIQIGSSNPPTVSPQGTTTPWNTPVTLTPEYAEGDGNITDYCISSGDECLDSVTVEGEGTWTVDENGVIEFTPEDGFVGEATPVIVTVTDEFGLTASAEINVEVLFPAAPTVNPINDLIGWNTNSTTYTIFNGVKAEYSQTCIIDPADNVCKTNVSVEGEGVWSYHLYSNSIVFTPILNYTGHTTELTYQMSDIWGRTATNTININVLEPALPSASHYTQHVMFEGNATFTPVVSSEADVETFCLISSGACVSSLTVRGGTFTINQTSGEISFTAEKGYEGDVEEVSYKVTNILGQSATNTINIIVDADQNGPREVAYANISGIIWLDLNHNNLKEDNEPLLPNVPVTLTENLTAPQGNTATVMTSIMKYFTPLSGETYTVYTDSQGRYNFDVTEGAYILTARITTNRLDPSWDSTGDMDWTVPVILAANESAVADFATAGTASMEGKVVFDNNEIIPNAQVMCTWEGMDAILPSDDDVVFYFTTDENGNFLAEGIPGGQFVCEGRDPNSGKTSSPLNVEVDQTSNVPAAAEMVVPTENAPAPETPKTETAAVSTEPLAYTGSKTFEMMYVSLIMTLSGAVFVIVSFIPKRRKTRKTFQKLS